MTRLNLLLQSKLFFALSLCFLICYVFIFTKVIKYKSGYDFNTSTLEGIITNYDIDGDKLCLELSAREKIIVNYYLSSLEEKNYYLSNLELGAKIKVEGTLNIPLNNTIPNTFNYQKYLYNKHIYYTFAASKINIISKNTSLINTIKNKIRLRASSFKKTSAYVQAFILGDKAQIDSNIYNTYQKNGVTHLFAVSGMHVGILVALIIFFLNKLKIKEKTSNIIVIIFLVFYMFLIGFTASVIRASLLYIFLIINKKINLNLPSINILYLVFMLLIIINPFYIYDLGFIYSFTTTFGLMLFSKKIKGNYLTKIFKVSLIAFIFSLPITISNFYEFNFLTIFNNIIIVPLVSGILFPLTLLTFCFPILENILAGGFNLLEIISKFLDTYSINIVIGKVNVLFIIIYYGIIYLIYQKGFKYFFFNLVLLIGFKYSYLFDTKNYVYFLDVGQGDASLIVSSKHKDVIMIDTGGKIEYEKDAWQIPNNSFNLADNLITFMKSLGITKLDLLALSHGDLDHLGYAQDLLKEIKTDYLMLNNNTFNYQEQELINQKIMRIKNNYQGQNVIFQNLNEIVNEDENTSSLVFYVKLHDYKLLYMGDAPKEIEKNIMAKYNLKVDFLKIGHHGSNTSSDYNFLKSVNPDLCIISSGRNNRYNHPSKETILNLEKLKLKYVNTQDKGTIKITLTKRRQEMNFYPP